MKTYEEQQLPERTALNLCLTTFVMSALLFAPYSLAMAWTETNEFSGCIKSFVPLFLFFSLIFSPITYMMSFIIWNGLMKKKVTLFTLLKSLGYLFVSSFLLSVGLILLAIAV